MVVVLIYISLIISDGEHLFMCLLPIRMSALEKLYSGLLPIFHLGCSGFFFLLLSCMSCYILEIKRSLVVLFETIFSHSGRLSFFFFFYGFLCCAKACKFD